MVEFVDHMAFTAVSPFCMASHEGAGADIILPFFPDYYPPFSMASMKMGWGANRRAILSGELQFIDNSHLFTCFINLRISAVSLKPSACHLLAQLSISASLLVRLHFPLLGFVHSQVTLRLQSSHIDRPSSYPVPAPPLHPLRMVPTPLPFWFLLLLRSGYGC